MKHLLIIIIAMFSFSTAFASEPTKTAPQSTEAKPAAKPKMKLAKKKEDKKTNSIKNSSGNKEKPAAK